MSRPLGPYAPARRVGNWVVTSGQVGVHPGPDSAPALVEGGAVPELRQAVANLCEVLAAEGAGLADVVKATLFLVDMAELGAVNQVWIEIFGDHRPTRSVVGVAALPLGARVEVEAWAHRPSG